MKKTVVLGASPNSSRYSNKAVKRLVSNDFEAIPVGVRQGIIEGIDIITETPFIRNVHTITLYINPERQKSYYNYILSLQPERIIFNPGTENTELMQLAQEKKIEVSVACTLVLLAVGEY
ncbi:MAG: CoA-binding protein [Saprospiraceae bacterium]